MAWSTPHTWTTGEVLTAANMNTYLSDNTTYLKSQTDLFNLAVYNNGSTTLAVGAPVIFDSAYTAGLGVTQTTSNSDPRTIGVVVTSAISGASAGKIWAPGYMIQSVLVSGVVTFGHSLVSSTVAQYAVDSNGAGIVPGMIGWALAASTGGTATINALIKVYPTVYVNAVTAAHYAGSTFASGSPATFYSVASDGNNRLLVVYAFDAQAGNPSGTAFSGTALSTGQAGSATNQYMGYLLSSAATANVTGTVSASGVASYVLFNGVNQSTPLGTVANANSASSSIGSVVISCSPGDYIVAGITFNSTAITVSSRASGQQNITKIEGAGVNFPQFVDYQYATGATCTFTWNLSGAVLWSATGAAIKSA
jgi:hypothetical protein